MSNLIPYEAIENKIYLIRGKKVLLDKGLAELYGVPTKRLNEQVRRNPKRFPPDFMFQLTKEEFLRCQNVISNPPLRSQIATSKRGGRRYLPMAFTEQGVAMLSSILNSERAIQVNIMIMRTFVKLRRLLSTHKKLAEKIGELEQKTKGYDTKFKAIFDTIHTLMEPPEKPTPKIGFLRD
ncbi:MAG: ORF6N domain-containing protein [Candidatus Saganbacteria bacterium]|nr:ORF6N domain-containing protein [Candidatus Saganbacteria bacterium]